MTRFRRLSIISLFATFILVAIGGLVRATQSGLGCGDDWPACNGRLAPALETRAEIIEFSHRFVAMIVGFMILGLAILALRHFRDNPRVLRPTLAALALVILQALLGALVVIQELKAETVVIHLVGSMSLLALLIYIVTKVSADQGTLRVEADASLSRQALGVALAVLVLLMVGSYLSSYPDRPPAWPLIDGRLIPDLGSEVFLVHFVHRALAAVVGVLLLVFCLRVIRRRAGLGARLARAALGLFALETIIGAANVWTDLNPVVVTLHLLSGGGIWASLVGLAVVTHPSLERVAERRPAPASRVALEGTGR
ncbi:MAG: COX15/CtaA family protein [Actinomycetota bacterium]